MSATYFRYEDVRYAPMLDESECPRDGGRLEVVLRTYRVRKVTLCGVQLDIGRFVLSSGRKRFAWPTQAEALVSFRARKQRQLSILRAQAARVEEALRLTREGPTPRLFADD